MTDKVANPDHYTSFAIQPLEYAMANKLPFAEANIIKYVSRWRGKNGVEDLKKARSMLDKLIAFEETGSMHGKQDQGELPLVAAAEEASLAQAGLDKAEPQVACLACFGWGRFYPDCSGAAEDCPLCNGTGKHDDAIAVQQHHGLVSEEAPDCGVCRGYGSNDYLKMEPCYRCKGSGKAQTLDDAQTKLVREFVTTSRELFPNLGDERSGAASDWSRRAAAYNALPDFLKD